MMRPCEVARDRDTNKPCTSDAARTVPLLYPSGLSETKWLCERHAVEVEEANVVNAAEFEARRAKKVAQAKARAAALRAESPPGAAENPPEAAQGAQDASPAEPPASEPAAPQRPVRGRPAPKPGRAPFAGVKSCRWCEIENPIGTPGRAGTFPFCYAHRSQIRMLRRLEQGSDVLVVGDDFDPATSDLAPIVAAWARRAESVKAKHQAVIDKSGGTPAPKPASPESVDDPDSSKRRADALLDAQTENGEAPLPQAESSAYADGHAAGDRDRMFRCRQDVGRALGLSSDCPADWGSLVDAVRRSATMSRETIVAYNETLESLRLVNDAINGRRIPVDGPPIAKAVAGMKVALDAAAVAAPPTAANKHTDEAANAIAEARASAAGEAANALANELASALRIGRTDGGFPGWPTLIDIVNDNREAALSARQADTALSRLRADSEELCALLVALRTGRSAPLRDETKEAVEAAEARMLGPVRDRARSHDDRVVGVMKFATNQILGVCDDAAEAGQPVDRRLLAAIRAIANGEVPEGAK